MSGWSSTPPAIRYGSWTSQSHGSGSEKVCMELGGEILTIGSDGHAPEQLAWDFREIPSRSSERNAVSAIIRYSRSGCPSFTRWKPSTKIPQTAGCRSQLRPCCGLTFIKINIPLLRLLHPRECLTWVSSEPSILMPCFSA